MEAGTEERRRNRLSERERKRDTTKKNKVKESYF